MLKNSSSTHFKTWFHMNGIKNRSTAQRSSSSVDLNSPNESGDEEALDKLQPLRSKVQLSKKQIRTATNDSGISEVSTSEEPSQYDAAQDVREKVIIALLGPSGCGKSTFIKLATGREDVAIGYKLDPCTTNIEAFEYALEGNKSVTFVDTPGYDLDGKNTNRVLKSLTQWLKNQSIGEKNTNLSAVLIFHRITDNRMTIATQSHINQFEKLVGKSNGHKRIFLVTTMWNEIDKQAGIKREDLLKTVHWKRMIAGGSEMYRFWNTTASAWDIVTPIIRGNSGDVNIPPHVLALPVSSAETDDHQYLDSEQALRAIEQIFWDQQRLLDKLQTIVQCSQGGGQAEQLKEVLVEERKVSGRLGSLLSHLKKQNRVRLWFTSGDRS